MTDFDPREAKLPVWAQSLIRQQRARVQHLEDLLRQDPVTSETKVVTDRYGDFPRPVNVEHLDSVTFFPRRYDGPDSFDVRLDGDSLYVMANSEIVVHQTTVNTARLIFKNGTIEDQATDHQEALAKGWSPEEIRLGLHKQHIANRRDVLL